MKLKFFKLAKRISINSDHPDHKIGAVLIKKNRVINIGFNQMKTSPKSPHAFKSRHAEFNCLIGIDRKELKGSELYVYRETQDSKPAMSRPCSSCLDLIKSLGIDIIHYSAYNNYITEVI